MDRARELPRRLILSAALGAAGMAVTAGCFGGPETEEPPDESPTPSPDESMLSDDIVEGVTVEDRGFAVHPAPNGDNTRRIVGAAAVLRNDTEQPMRVHVRFRFVDEAGRGWHSEERNDWAGIICDGWAYLPPGQAVDLGDMLQFDVDDAVRVARIVLYVLGQPAPPSPLLRARIEELTPGPPGDDEWDYVTFEVDNPGRRFEEPNYVLVYRSREGTLIGGWFVNRAHWWDIDAALPENETDHYPPGTSRHTLPTWLPPGTQPTDVTMYVWP
ncbi:MAG TPA: hypothetical protein VK028_02120 [Micromonosporaceae bacterium]|nr:hypothetical protein [Micromonosporaceae bacterium]